MEVATPRHLQPVARIPCTATPKSGPKPLLPMLFIGMGGYFVSAPGARDYKVRVQGTLVGLIRSY